MDENLPEMHGGVSEGRLLGAIEFPGFYKIHIFAKLPCCILKTDSKSSLFQGQRTSDLF